MRLTKILLLLIFPAALCRAQDTLTVSPRVGKIIDAYEREYFGLFPEEDEFVEALFLVSPAPNECTLAVQASGANRTYHTLDLDAVRALGPYLDGFEAKRQGLTVQRDFLFFRLEHSALFDAGLVWFPTLAPLQKIRFRVASSSSDTTVETGLLLFCDSIWTGILPAVLDRDFLHPQLLRTETIRGAAFHRAGTAWPGIAWGAGLAVFCTMAMASAIGGDGHGGTTPTGVVYAYGIVAAIPAMVIGAIISSLRNNDFDEQFPMGLHNAPSILKQLQALQFYSNGLPPELKQQLYPE